MLYYQPIPHLLTHKVVDVEGAGGLAQCLKHNGLAGKQRACLNGLAVKWRGNEDDGEHIVSCMYMRK